MSNYYCTSTIADTAKDVNDCVMNYTSTKSLQECSTNTKLIRIRNSTLRTIPNEIFQRFPLLSSLDLVEEGITTLDGVQFSSKQKINKLDLSNNAIASIPANVFINLANLQTLFLMNNTINQVDPKAFVGLTSLEQLDLDKNQISSLQEGVFQPLVSLKDFTLVSNKLQVIDPDLFSKTISLHTLDLRKNAISAIEEKAFWSLGELEVLRISQNPFYEIDLTHLPKIRSIEIEETNLTSITIPQSLQKLFANGNKISRIFVPDTTSLETLQLSRNELKDFYNVSRLSNVRFLELAYNDITNFNLSRLSNMRKLESLDLFGNQLQEFDVSSIRRYLPKLNFIKLTVGHWNVSYVNKIVNSLNKNLIHVEIDKEDDKKAEQTVDKHIITPQIDDKNRDTASKTAINDSISKQSANLELDENYKKLSERVENVDQMFMLMLTLFCLYIAFQGALYYKRQYFPSGFRMRMLMNNRNRSAADTEAIFQESLQDL